MRGAKKAEPAAEVESKCIVCSSDFRFICTSMGPGLAGENARKEKDLQCVLGCVTALWLSGRPLRQAGEPSFKNSAAQQAVTLNEM